MKKKLVRLGIGALLFTGALFIPADGAANGNGDLYWIRFISFLIAYLVVGYKVLYKALRNIRYGKVFDENFLMAIASIGAFAIGEYPEAVAVMLFYQIGEMFEDYAVGKSRKSIADLMNIRPDYANLKMPDGSIKEVSPEEVKIGDIIVIKPGEKVPVDGIVLKGKTSVDTAALTGESLPRSTEEGNDIISGCINLSGLIEVKVTKEFGESTVSRILELVENATTRKAKTEAFITRFAAVYTPAVVFAAVALAVLPPLIIDGALFTDWLYRALNFLVVSCPCALVISVPLGFFGGIGAASKNGVLVKGSNYLEAVAHTEYVVMDKTGTLTKGVFKVEEIHPEGDISQEQLLRLAAYAESGSNHPISLSLKEAYYSKTDSEIDRSRIGDIEEIAGHGVSAVVDGNPVLAGNAKLMELKKVSGYDGLKPMGTVVHVALCGKYAGYITIADQIKADAPEAIKGLESAGIKTVMLTGDNKEVAKSVCEKLGVTQFFAELLPEKKVEIVEELLDKKTGKGRLLFVGDGINDAPVLARADVGVAMGGLGSDAAIEAADVVIMTDEPSKLLSLMDIARKTLKIVKQNIVFALAVKLLVLVLSALGLVDMWAAVFADVGVSVIAILNSLRALSAGKDN